MMRLVAYITVIRHRCFTAKFTLQASLLLRSSFLSLYADPKLKYYGAI